jgi:hypothetical protein
MQRHHQLAALIAASDDAALRLHSRVEWARMFGQLVEPVSVDELQSIAYTIVLLAGVARQQHAIACVEASP